jgi:nitrate/nitrite transporter NarK
MVALTTRLLLFFPVLGWGVRVQSPTAPYWELLVLAFLAGIGGGAFSGFMPSTSYFFPKPAGHGARVAGGHRQLRCLARAVADAVPHRHGAWRSSAAASR